MEKSNIKDVLIFSNMIELMRKVNSKVVARCSEFLPEESDEVVDNSPALHATVLMSRMGIKPILNEDTEEKGDTDVSEE